MEGGRYLLLWDLEREREFVLACWDELPAELEQPFVKFEDQVAAETFSFFLDDIRHIVVVGVPVSIQAQLLQIIVHYRLYSVVLFQIVDLILVWRLDNLLQPSSVFCILVSHRLLFLCALALRRLAMAGI